MSAKSPSIESLSSVVQDNGRRGAPRAGCDCMQCFGYCQVDEDVALRTRALANDAAYKPSSSPLDFSEPT